jgi:arylsulfatase A-like enzyme
MAYEEGIHIPLIIRHPDVSGGQSCRALTSHLDIVPTLLSMAGMSERRRGDAAGRDLPGKDHL